MPDTLSKELTIIISGVLFAAIIIFSFSNWRLGVKAAFIAILLEGAIRKWLFPQAKEFVYFLKDIFLIGAYLRFYIFPDASLRLVRVRAPIFAFVLLCVVLSLFAINPAINSFIVAAYGVKIYLYYIPLAFMIPYLFRDENDLVKNINYYLLLAIPICILGIAQFFSPTFSVLNSITEDEFGAVVFTDSSGIDRARITGSFSYITNFGSFLQVFTVLSLASISIKESKYRSIILCVILPLLVVNALMTGSRTTVVLQVLSMLFFVCGSMFFRIGTAQNTFVTIIIAICLACGVVGYIFSEAVDAFTTRTMATRETPLERFEMQWQPLPGAYASGGMTGLGIGLTHPASGAIRKVVGASDAAYDLPLYDAEIPQVLVEIGLLGVFIWYSIRFLALLNSIQIFLKCPPRPLRAFIFSAVLVHGMALTISLVLNHTFHFYYWALYGLTLTATRHNVSPR